MRKKPSLNEGLDDVLQQAANARNQAQPGKVAVVAPDEYSGSAVNLRKTDWKLLRRVAEARAELRGGRPSVSKVIESLIDAARKDLDAEVQ